jgi:hypothetical protein
LSVVNPAALLSGFDGRDLVVMAAIVLLLEGVARLTGLPRGRAAAPALEPAEGAPSRAYLERLLGPARSHRPIFRPRTAAARP